MNLNRAYRATALSVLVVAMAGGLTACNDQDKTKNADASATPAATAQTAPAPAPAATPAAAAPVHHHHEHQARETQVATASVCGNCGKVTAVSQVKDEGQASGAGAVGGAVAGGVLGHQAGKGRGKDAMTVLGAIGGAVAGNYAEKQIRATHHYEVSVRFNDGSTQIFKFKEKPGFQVGDHVKSDGDSLMAE